MYQYTAQVLQVIDGDTLRCRIDLGFKVRMDHDVRLLGLNCPELPTPEGQAAAQFVTDWLNQHALVEGLHVTENAWTIQLGTVKDKAEKYGRYLGTVWGHTPPGDLHPGSLNAALLATGHAKPYP